jgi:hypothetical protein
MNYFAWIDPSAPVVIPAAINTTRSVLGVLYGKHEIDQREHDGLS